MSDNFSLSSKVRMINALNRANGKVLLVESDVYFGAVIDSTVENRNSTVVLTPSGNKFSGKRTVHYNRLNLAIAFAALEVPALVIPSAVTRTHELLPLILQQYGVLLLPEEIIDEDLTTPDIILRTVPGAIGWVGSVTIDSGGVVVPPVINGFMLDDGSFFALDDGSLFYLDDMNVTLQP